jgi:hypothetical protein
LGVSKSQQKNKKQARKEKREKKDREEKRSLFLSSFFRAANSVLMCFAQVLCCFLIRILSLALLAFCESFWWCFVENVTAGGSFLLVLHNYRRFIIFRVCLLLRLIVLAALKGLSRVYRCFLFSLSSGHPVLWLSFYATKLSVRICFSALLGTILVSSIHTSMWDWCAYGVIAALSMSLWMPSKECSVGPKKIVFDTRYRRLRIPGTHRTILFRTRPSSPFLDIMPPRGFFLPGEIIIETLPRGAAKCVRQLELLVPYWVIEPSAMCPCAKPDTNTGVIF